jgi:ATP-dependent Clp protease ATP-binding subunit ClpC
MFSKFTNHLNLVLNRARLLAESNLSSAISGPDLILALVAEKGSLAREILLRSGFKITEAEEKELTAKKVETDEKFIFEKEVAEVLEKSVVWAAEYESYYVGTEHLLFTLFVLEDKKIDNFLQAKKVNLDDLATNLKVALSGERRLPEAGMALKFNQGELENALNQFMQEVSGETDLLKEEEKSKTSLTRVKEKPAMARKEKRGLLDVFARNLTETEVQAQIDPVIGREEEIKRIIQILCRRTKNNPVLLGDAGVGKTAIVEGLAKKIMLGEVPDVLLNKKIYALDINMLISGAVMRGEFEGRLKQVIEEVRADKNIILFIDEIHMIVGAGAVTGAVDAANVLKPALARGEIRCLGATTFEDYKKYVEEDAALERRFQPVMIGEPRAEEALEILAGIKNNYEKHHQVKISSAALAAAVKLSARYIPERFLPDKAIDLIDEAAAKIRVEKGNLPKLRQIRLLEEKREQIVEKKVTAIREEKYQEALTWRDEEMKIQEKIVAAKQEAEAADEWLGEIGAKEVAAVVAEMKKIPMAELETAEDKKIANLEKKLGEFILGQAEPLEEISFFIKRAQAGLAPAGRPQGSFIFAGLSGVGKTETAKVLAREIFGSEKRLIRIDMSELAESFNVSRLIGSPPGYVGFKEGGKLTEAVRRQPYAVVLFDEIEKAHAQVFNILLQILEDGQLTDATGKVVDFKNTIIILTTNLGVKNLKTTAFGFDTKQEREHQERLKEKICEAVKSEFNPELINRVDKLIIFNPLTVAVVEKIVKMELAKLETKMKEKGIKLKIAPAAIKFLAQKSFSEAAGAREVRHILQTEVETKLIEKILLGEIKKGEARVEAKRGKIIIK